MTQQSRALEPELQLNPYRFRRYDSRYKRFFVLERARLRKTLGNSARIRHIGSTSVPGLGGKGILDIVVGVNKRGLALAKRELTEGGYEYRETASTKQRLFFRRFIHARHRWRKVHVHLTAFGGKDWNEMVGFRDYLIEHPEAAEEYTKFKKDAVKKARGEGKVYRKHKERFVQNILKRL